MKDSIDRDIKSTASFVLCSKVSYWERAYHKKASFSRDDLVPFIAAEKCECGNASKTCTYNFGSKSVKYSSVILIDPDGPISVDNIRTACYDCASARRGSRKSGEKRDTLLFEVTADTAKKIQSLAESVNRYMESGDPTGVTVEMSTKLDEPLKIKIVTTGEI